jgi:hypothetical protein
MNKSRIIAVNLSANPCPARGCVILDQPQHLAKTWLSGVFHALQLVFAAAALLSVPIATVTLLLLCPASAHAQGGLPLWTNRYSLGVDPGMILHTAIAVDGNGNAFVTGVTYNADTNQDYATIKYSGAGLPLWTNHYNGPGNGIDVSSAIAVDRSGNVFVTGYSWNGTDRTTGDYATIAYSNLGVPLWTNRYDGPGSASDQATAIAVDSSGNVFVTGSTVTDNMSGMTLLDDYATVAYSSAGVPLWTNRYDGPGSGADWASAIAVDNNGNVFVTGGSDDGNGFSDYATIKYSNAGLPLWTNRYDGPTQSSDSANAIAVDSTGNVFVTGESSGNGSADYATVAYSNAGVPLWTHRYNGPGNGGDSARALALDRAGNVFVTGYSWNGTNNDYVTIKYSSSVPPPRLDFQKLNNLLVLSWTNAGFNLQTAPVVTGPFTNLPAATSPYTNPLTAPQQFFRLISN